MALGKRKRQCSKRVKFEGDNHNEPEHDRNQPPGFTPFAVEVLRNEQSRPKSRRIDGKRVSGSIDWSSVKSDVGFTAESTAVYYAIQPGQKWESMKRYKSFIST